MGWTSRESKHEIWRLERAPTPREKSEAGCDPMPNLTELRLDALDDGSRIPLLIVYIGRRCRPNYSVICQADNLRTLGFRVYGRGRGRARISRFGKVGVNEALLGDARSDPCIEAHSIKGREFLNIHCT